MPGESEPSPVECRQIAELLADYIEGTLPSHTRELLDWHIESCGPCVAFVKTYRETVRAVRTIPDIPIPPELKQRLLSFLRSRDS